ncbi:hypothetical protein ANN_15809 [Periplaneta americana]|uniref:Uncharacterized protein n=1 Tax=Periplaneta americana TaxID=6978 RepID=A0ABQ8SHZ2_PERAM|nr:hypothetical protein ANN_15809 [Periplaneta americana]
MLLEDVDDILPESTNMREALNSPRIADSSKSKPTASETHVDAMNNSEACGPRMLHQSKTCGCIYDGGKSDLGTRKQKVTADDCMVPRVQSLDFAENGFERKPRNINEGRVHRDVNMNVSAGDRSCPRICIDSTRENRHVVTVANDEGSEDDDGFPVIRLRLRKPRHWKWKLTTSASSPAIFLPVIRLLDERGDLLLDTRERCLDSNGNENDFKPSVAIQRTRSDISCCLSNEPETSIISENIQQDDMGNLLLDDTTETEETESKKKTKKSKCLDGSSRSMDNEKSVDEDSKADGLISMSGEVSSGKGASRKLGRSKPHLHSRRTLRKRHNYEESSSSSDSSPEVHRKLRRRKKGGQEGRREARRTGNMCPGVELTDEGMYGLCLRVVSKMTPSQVPKEMIWYMSENCQDAGRGVAQMVERSLSMREVRMVETLPGRIDTWRYLAP